jgi:tetratricopeptide (TPR) repeat protein
MFRTPALRLSLSIGLLGLVAAAADDRTKSPVAPASDDIGPVKRLIAARQEYQTALEELRLFYQRQGDLEHVRWVEDELLSYHRISKRAYRLELDVPPPTLTPNQNIPEANDLFRRAVAFQGKGWGQEADDNYRRAELLFQQLLTMYPQSDKLSETAYHLGEIYESRAFKQFRRAATYYERCFQWNPQTPNESRLRAARLYDRVLQDRSKAMQLYRDEITHTADPKRLDEARKRLHELGSTPP